MRINTIYESISGEGGFLMQGTWLTFVRTQGCTLRCSWCDTPQALEHKQSDAKEMSVRDILLAIHTRNVLITGGEPLEQKDFGELLAALYESNHVVQVETGGHMAPIGSSGDAFWVVDYKCPSSQMVHRMPSIPDFCDRWKDYSFMVKFVVESGDIPFAIDCMTQMKERGYYGSFLISPSGAQGSMIPGIVEAIRSRNSLLLHQTVFSIQIHKLINAP